MNGLIHGVKVTFFWSLLALLLQLWWKLCIFPHKLFLVFESFAEQFAARVCSSFFLFFNEALINADQRLLFQFETGWLTKAEVKRFKRTCTEATVSFLIVIAHNPSSNNFFFFVFTPVCQTGQILNGAAHHPLPFSPLLPSSQGLLSFLSAPLIGALSDVWGRKSFLLLTVFFTCAPIPLMKISPW